MKEDRYYMGLWVLLISTNIPSCPNLTKSFPLVMVTDIALVLMVIRIHNVIFNNFFFTKKGKNNVCEGIC